MGAGVVITLNVILSTPSTMGAGVVITLNVIFQLQPGVICVDHDNGDYKEKMHTGYSTRILTRTF